MQSDLSVRCYQHNDPGHAPGFSFLQHQTSNPFAGAVMPNG